jgi:hypothetical protein
MEYRHHRASGQEDAPDRSYRADSPVPVIT